ncbi:S10 family peptidase [Alteromonas oceanisediminis]|uniref:S10 family peptidase n=1 Tax=Alteromonas oceanisediminis TaxID=2836180 RepID=UPI001BDA2EC6|nr:peptidase S10 [Alteromonas oceanisediminis]MBT0586239.1 peptidase S10 [Alteromonas oceanisediminis]
MLRFLIACWIVFASVPVVASTPAESTTHESSPSIAPPVIAKTTHQARINGAMVSYRVEAGDTHLTDKDDKPTASIFSTAYFREGVDQPNERPILFIFNGGPGSSSVWLHMGVFGPKRVKLPSDAERVGAAPFSVIDNPGSLIDIADMVFIDPVGTGYSTALGETEAKTFWGVREDADSLAEFVRLFITRHQRWNSPKYLAGESYGTTRAAAMVKSLQEGWGSIDLNGVLLISSILDFQAGDFTDGNDLPYVTFLPTYAATAWYHDVVPDKSQWSSFEGFIDAVREFSLEDYATALIKGSLMAESERQHVIEQLHQFTGLRKQYLQQSDLRVDEFLFMKELLRDRGEVVGRLDSRYLGEDASIVSNRFEADPSAYAIDGAYTAAIQSYFASDLDVQRDARYHVLSGEVFSGWNWLYGNSARSQGFLNVTPILAKAMRQNKDFRIFVANGYYDLATPFFATEHSMNHHGIDRDRVDMKYYQAGHMMYIHQPSMDALIDDMRAFLTR